ncbi:MAG: (S)-ureidoglycine aminohydrolase [Devosiaceae bacterium]|nr:(S)-ureidoglycine aminohydrolase [Devosiaceae bacterium]
MTNTYYSPQGGLPPQSQLLTGRAVFTDAYAVIPKGVMSDIVTSNLPHWDKTRAWILARPLSGFAETFAQYIMEVAPGGGSKNPEPEQNAQGVLFVTEGEIVLTLENKTHTMVSGGYAYIPPAGKWSMHNNSKRPCKFHWIRKVYEPVEGMEPPISLVTNENQVNDTSMPDTNGTWTTKRFVNTDDVAHDMCVNIVSLKPGAVIPFAETHVMEHGLYVLQGKAVYRLNQDWVEVEAGDFMWLRAFCPQACYAGGPDTFRYLLYKDINRHPKLKI